MLVSGNEDYLATRAIARLRQLLLLEDPDLEITDVHADEYTPGLLQSLASPSLFGEARLIRVDRVEKTNDAFLTEATAYAAAPADGTTLVLRHAGGNRGKRLLDAVRASNAAIEVPCATPKKEDRWWSDFAHAEFRAEGRQATSSAIALLLNSFGTDVGELATACQQLIADTQGEITDEVVQKYYRGHIEVDAFDVARTAAAGDGANALLGLRHAIDSGVALVPLVAAFAYHFRTLAKVSTGSSAAQLGVHPRGHSEARAALRAWSESGLVQAIELIAATDEAIKGGERDADAAVHRMVLQLSLLRGRS
ncbi:DNA polymerase III subunit delta [Humidisolicoccus flavus]|uniref:DNA polymerase III subunit delta n=1 Tax=Humidisolicoccus flavus TaxID=3111414 RepID=UPI00324C14FF